MIDLKHTLAALVAIDTTSARSNLPLIDLLELRLERAGFDCRRHAYLDEGGVEKTNLIARKGEPKAVADLALVGHTDCVPFDADWKEALLLTEREGKLFGRGACDTKAFVACALHAAEGARIGAGKTLQLLFTADEEVGCVGAKRLAQEGIGRARYAIVGEPTSLRPIRANKGYCLGEVELRGVEGHSAYPESGRSAIFRAGRFLQKLEARAQGQLRVQTDARFTPPFTTLNVGVISGGKAKNIIPGLCRFTVEWRPIPGQDVTHVRTLLEELAEACRSEEPDFDVTVRVHRMDRGFDTADSSALLRFLVERTGKPADTVAFGTEGPQLVELGAEPVVIGPGDIRTAHRTGEFVPVDELLRCEALLAEAVAHFCG